MNESKELLEATIKGLEERLESVKSDLGMKVKELADVNKPEMTGEMFDKLTELVDDAIGHVSLDSDDLEYSMEIDYDNKINLYDVSLNDPQVIGEQIMCYIDGYYKIVEDKE